MAKLCSAPFKYENRMKIGREILCTVLKCTQMRARVEKVDILGWTKSSWVSNYMQLQTTTDTTTSHTAINTEAPPASQPET